MIKEGKNKEYKQVRVTWVDSITGDCAWQLTEGFEDFPPVTAVTLGFVVAEDKQHITIAQNLASPPQQVCNTMSIPKCSIISVENL